MFDRDDAICAFIGALCVYIFGSRILMHRFFMRDSVSSSGNAPEAKKNVFAKVCTVSGVQVPRIL